MAPGGDLVLPPHLEPVHPLAELHPHLRGAPEREVQHLDRVPAAEERTGHAQGVVVPVIDLDGGACAEERLVVAVHEHEVEGREP